MAETVHDEQLVGIDQVAGAVADATLDELGIKPESPTVTHHDVRRAARLAAQKALEFYDNNPLASRGEQ